MREFQDSVEDSKQSKVKEIDQEPSCKIINYVEREMSKKMTKITKCHHSTFTTGLPL